MKLWKYKMVYYEDECESMEWTKIIKKKRLKHGVINSFFQEHILEKLNSRKS